MTDFSRARTCAIRAQVFSDARVVLRPAGPGQDHPLAAQLPAGRRLGNPARRQTHARRGRGATRVNHYVLKNGAATDVVYYWYQGRGRVVANEYRVKWNLLRDAALLGHTEEALVRIVIPVHAHGAGTSSSPEADRAFAAADSIGDRVAQQLIREVARVLPGKAS